MFFLWEQFVVRIILQVIFALLVDDVEGREDVEGVIDAALDILVLDSLV